MSQRRLGRSELSETYEWEAFKGKDNVEIKRVNRRMPTIF